MKRKLSLNLFFLISINLFSQQLFVTKRDYSDSSNYVHSLLEINQENGNTISTYDFSSNFPNSYSPESLVFNSQSNEIIGISDKTIVKYNLSTNIETSFELPTIQSVDYRDLILVQNNALGINDQNLQKTVLKPQKAYNILGQEVPLDTKNEIIIIKYEDGSTKKIIIQ